MLYSMTGFGSAMTDSNDYRVQVEIKTLNSKFLDFMPKLPRELLDKENEIKSMVSEALKRGKINLTVELIPVNLREPNVHLNEELLKSYYHKYARIAGELNADQQDLFRLALHSPDVLISDESGANVPWKEIKRVIEEAIRKCIQFRRSEGDSLQKKLESYVNGIREGLQSVDRQDEERMDNIRKRLGASMEEIREKVQIDTNRFEQELIYYIEKIDITEEKVRLSRHLDYFLEVMTNGDAQGKKLGFISQEIGREINTIGAKANDAAIQRAVVQMKDELEKIKEQTMNVI